MAIREVIAKRTEDMTMPEIRGNLFAFGHMERDIYDDIINFQRQDWDPFKRKSFQFSCMMNVKHILKYDGFPDLFQDVMYTKDKLIKKAKEND